MEKVDHQDRKHIFFPKMDGKGALLYPVLDSECGPALGKGSEGSGPSLVWHSAALLTEESIQRSHHLRIFPLQPDLEAPAASESSVELSCETCLRTVLDSVIHVTGLLVASDRTPVELDSGLKSSVVEALKALTTALEPSRTAVAPVAPVAPARSFMGVPLTSTGVPNTTHPWDEDMLGLRVTAAAGPHDAYPELPVGPS